MDLRRAFVPFAMALAVAALLGACSLVPPPVPETPTSTTTSTTSTTAPVPVPTTPGAGTVGLLVWGDAGTGTATQTQVAQQMTNWATTHPVDALFEVGDVVYDVGDPSLFASRVDAPYAALSASRPFWVALGNHDVATADGDQLLAHMGLPGHWYEQVLVDDGVSVQLLVLDSNHVSDAQTRWLDERLSTGSYTWRIVAFHHPAYSCGPHGNTPAVLDQWVPVIRRHDVDLVLSGHDHSYQRFLDGSTTHVVTGGGGAGTTAVSNCATGATSVSAAQRHHFVGLEATGSGLTLTVVARTGETLDSVVLR